MCKINIDRKGEDLFKIELNKSKVHMPDTENFEAVLSEQTVQKEFTYDQTTVLTFLATYPEVRLAGSQNIQNRINLYYRAAVRKFYRYAEGPMRRDAIMAYRDSKQNGFPFNTFDAVMKYTVTMNEACHLSTYFDRYEYTGGAHGNTRRFSVNWDLRTGRMLQLSDLFERGENYRKLILDQIILIAEQNIKENPGIYFDEYRELIVKYFNPESFLLTPTALQIYYQQYEIAPYSTGIVVFDLPYRKLGIDRPNCGRLHVLK